MTTVDFTTGTIDGQMTREIQRSFAADGAEDFPNGHGADETHPMPAVGEHNPPAPARPDASSKELTLGLASTDLPDGQSRRAHQTRRAVGDHKQPEPATHDAQPKELPPVLAPTLEWTAASAVLGLCADILDDVESIRIATENRLRQITRTEVDKDGIQRGFAIPAGSTAVQDVAYSLHGMKHDSSVLKELDYPIRIVRDIDENGKPVGRACLCMECSAIRNLAKALRAHPLGPWVAANPGIGEKQGARLIAAIGDPYWNSLHNRPRLVSELWAYCGLHVLPAAQTRTDLHSADGGGGKQGNPGHTAAETQGCAAGVAPTRTRGQKANWNDTARKRAWLVADRCILILRKPCERIDGDDFAVHVEGCTCSPYRLVYDAARVKYQDAIHHAPCRRCGPSGQPAEVGSPLSMAHKKARAVRIVAKEILRDLWLESKRLHELT